MRVIVCLDDNGGMLFNGRRLSRDRKVIEKIMEMVGENKLWISGFSRVLFENGVIVDDNFPEKAAADDYCFVEDRHLAGYADRISRLYVFKWNRKYPSDFKFDIDLDECFHLAGGEEFAGNSHEKITLEVWKR